MPEDEKPPELPKEIEFGITTECELLGTWLDLVLEALERASGTEVWLVTDLSCIGEVIEDEEVEKMAKDLGVPIDPHDLFIDVAKRLKKARE
jgi:hypothetical protein